MLKWLEAYSSEQGARVVCPIRDVEAAAGCSQECMASELAPAVVSKHSQFLAVAATMEDTARSEFAQYAPLSE